MQTIETATFTEEQRIAYYECDVNNKIKISNVMRRTQQLCALQMDLLNLGYEKLIDNNMVFLLSKVGIKIDDMPNANQQIVASTTPIGTDKAIFIRETNYESENGESLITVETDWILTDPITRRIIRPQAFFEKYNMPTGNQKNEHSICSKKYIKPQSFDIVHQRVVKYSDLDCNGHINNAVYGDIICDYIPFEYMMNRKIDSLYINYKSEAKLDETLEISVAHTDNNTFYIYCEHNNKECFTAEVVFK